MRLVTNAGSNLSELIARELDITLIPQHILVDGIPHDCSDASLTHARVDELVRTARLHPTVRAPEPRELLRYLSLVAESDPEVLLVTTSRRLIATHDAAVAARAELAKSADPRLRAARIEIVDTGVTDIGAGLVMQAAAQARNAGLSLDAAAAFTRAFAARSANLAFVNALDNLIKGGRANFLQAWVANFLDVRPVLALVDGELRAVGRRRARSDMVARAVEHFATVLAPGTEIWAAVAHGGAPEVADALAERLRAVYSVEYLFLRPLSPSIYLHTGPRALLAFAYPVNGLPLRLIPPRST